MEHQIEYEGYSYTVTDISGTGLSTKEAYECAVGLDEFLFRTKIWGEQELEELRTLVRKDGLTEKVSERVYEAFYDMCFYGPWKTETFLECFDLSEDQLNKILM